MAKKREIPFAIGVMNNKHIKVGKGSVRIDSLFSNLKIGEQIFYKKRKTLYSYTKLSIVALKLKDEYLILATNIILTLNIDIEYQEEKLKEM